MNTKSISSTISFRSWLLAALCLILPAATSPAEPVRLHPQNGHYFLFRQTPVVLVGSSEHYGALINLDFDYIPYFDEARSRGLNLVRIFSGAYREAPGSFGIQDNTLGPSASRSLAPWMRTAATGAADGGNKFDLTQWDPHYFDRLRDLVSEAGQRGIVVELTFFSAFYDDSLWNLSPMNPANHINGAGSGGRANCYNATGDLVPYQKALARKCAEELAAYDNVVYEICNEPYMGNVSQAWQNLIINELVAAEPEASNRHLIAQNFYNYQGVVSNPHPSVSIINFHYAYPNAAVQNYGLNRALGDDETGLAGTADFTYRREAWEFMLSGGGWFNHLDFSFTASRENGTATSPAPGGGGLSIRRQLGILRGFLEDLPLTDLTPQPDLVAGGVPSGGAARVMGAAGMGYGIYLRGGTQANLVLNLPPGTYHGGWIDTKTGSITGSVSDFTHAGGQRTLVSPAYSEDIALRLVAETPPPAGPQLLVNGSFESGYTGWTPAGNQGIHPSGTDGAKGVAFNGANLQPNGTLVQSFTTTPGVSYQLSLDAGVVAYNLDPQSLKIDVAGDGVLISPSINLTGKGNGVTYWVPHAYMFVANSTTTTLTLRDQSSTTQNLDLLVDNVRVHGPAGTTSNTAPGATADSYTAQKETVLEVPPAGVLANDTDEESDPLTAMLIAGPSHGIVTLNADGGFIYTPEAAYTGADSFTYQANDGLLDSNVVTVSIQVVSGSQISPGALTMSGTPGNITLSLNATQAGSYVLERSEDLIQWVVADEIRMDAPGLIEFHESQFQAASPPPATSVFYRIGKREE